MVKIARVDTPLASEGIINGKVCNTFGIENGKIVSPSDPAGSLLHLRMSSTSMADQMPPFTRNVIDTVAMGVLSDRIRAQALAPDSTNR